MEGIGARVDRDTRSVYACRGQTVIIFPNRRGLASDRLPLPIISIRNHERIPQQSANISLPLTGWGRWDTRPRIRGINWRVSILWIGKRQLRLATGNFNLDPWCIYIYAVVGCGVIYRTLCNGRDFYNNVGHWRHGNWRKEKKKD